MTLKSLPKLIELVKPIKLNPVSEYGRKFMERICQDNKLLTIATGTSPRNVGQLCGERSYMLLGSLAKLERALMKWSMNELVTRYNFTPVVVPNIVYDNVIEKCGFPTISERSQVFKVSGNVDDSVLDENSPLSNSENKTHSCLAGTSEFALVSIHIGDTIEAQNLPKKYCALSRCYRAETSRSSSEWGLYRVRYFNKVEMVALTMPQESEETLEEFVGIQKNLFSQLGIGYKVLEMPPEDLGLSASKKYDIEAWLEGRQRFGEVSSTSNCTDYQSSRLDIKYAQMVERDNQLQIDTGFVHTVNGTACSSIRTLIVLIEQHQNENGRVDIPKPLIPYMNGITSIPTEQDATLLKCINLYPTEI